MKKTYYYIAKRKSPHQAPRYVGDGIVEMENKREVWEYLQYNYGGLSKKHSVIRLK